jgi:hypothetical protein
MSGSMKCKAALIVVLSIGGLPALLGQQSSGTGTTLSLPGVVSALGGVPNSTASTVMQFTAARTCGCCTAPEVAAMAGFEVTLYGRICGDHRGFQSTYCCGITGGNSYHFRTGPKALALVICASQPIDI